MMINKTNTGCTPIDYGEPTTELPARQIPAPTHCGPYPYKSSIVVDKSSGNFSIGAQLPYACIPCTYFPPASSPGVITCGPDGRWIFPNELCVFGPDVGFLRTGEPIPINATGCNAECPSTSTNGFSFFGNVSTLSKCYCDGACCAAGDCCFDAICYPRRRFLFDEAYYIANPPKR